MNDAEKMFDNKFGVYFNYMRNGYPDRLVKRNDGKWVGVEVKRNHTDILKHNQFEMLKILHNQGIPCYVYWFDTNSLIRIDEYQRHLDYGSVLYCPIVDADGIPLDKYAGCNDIREWFTKKPKSYYDLEEEEDE